MGEGTEYFTPEFFAFFRGLSKNNRKEWFDANKVQFQAAVLEPSVRFVRDAGDRLKKISPHIVGDARAFGGSISRIYRDIRFSPDKSPYKTHIGIHFWHDKAGPPPKGLHRIASLPRHRRREPGFPREFRERMRVDGPSKPIPSAVDGIAVVTST